jgi:hypothetical protein
MRLVLVHGRSQGGKDPIKLKSDWLTALGNGLKRAGLDTVANLSIDFPFYGDRLDEFVREFELPADPAIVPKGNAAFDEYAAFRAEIANEMRIRAAISDDEIRSQMRSAPTEKGIQNWEWVQAAVRLLDRHVTDVSQTTIEVFLRDVFLYTRREVVSTAINKIVAESISTETAVLVAHSLGTVVAYNVLKALPTKIPLFVTVGSPLAIRAIRKTLAPICNPAGASGWYNAYDARDIVALYPLDNDNFGVMPAVANNGTVNNWTENRHGIAGYLDDARVAKTVWTGLQPLMDLQ